MSDQIVKALEKISEQLPEPDRRGLVIVNRPGTIRLPDPCNVEVVCEVRAYQQVDANESDQLSAAGIIWIATGKDREMLPDSIAFGARLAIGGHSLTPSWGWPSHRLSWRESVGPVVDNNIPFPWRHSAIIIGQGDTWIEALMDAERKTLREIAELWVAVENRHAKLSSEGEEYALAGKLLPN